MKIDMTINEFAMIQQQLSDEAEEGQYGNGENFINCITCGAEFTGELDFQAVLDHLASHRA